MPAVKGKAKDDLVMQADEVKEQAMQVEATVVMPAAWVRARDDSAMQVAEAKGPGEDAVDNDFVAISA